MDVARRSADWLGEVVDLMREPTITMPIASLLRLLRQVFGSTSSWNWFDADGSFGMVMDPAEVPQRERETRELWESGQLFDSHALVRWFQITGDLGPQTTARVPTRIISQRQRRPLERTLSAMAMEHQLSIAYRHRGPMHRAFVMARGRWDFSEDDLAVAKVVQRSLVALDHQVRVMQRLKGAHTGTDLGLTGRELAVLQLVADGATVRGTARTLACSPRTVEKHLQNAYRRLGVKDRLNAVRVLRVAGVLGAVPVPDHQAVTGPGAYRGLSLLKRINTFSEPPA